MRGLATTWWSVARTVSSPLLVGGRWRPPAFVPTRLHTYRFQLNLTRLPAEIWGAAMQDGQMRSVRVSVKDKEGRLLASAMPAVRSEKYGAYQPRSIQPGSDEPRLVAIVADGVARYPLAGIIGEKDRLPMAR